MSVKKTVTHQQLYSGAGSNRYMRPAHPTAPARGNTVEYNIAPAQKSHRCLQHSQSITALPDMDLCGSYATLRDHMAPAPLTAVTCKRHLNTSNVGRFYAPADACCCAYKAPPVVPAAQTCLCGNAYQQSYQPTTVMHDSHKAYGNGCYFGYELGNHLTDEEDSAFPALADREFHMLHRNIPALRRTGVDTTSIRQYFYPDGGWGWIICSMSFLAHIITTGLQLSYGLFLYYAVHHLEDSHGIEWLGALSWSVSMLATPFVVTFCRKKSTRLLAVIGGLVLPLGILFTSFATELGQIFFSYGILFGIGVSMVRESSTIMLGNYFKQRRRFVEMVAMSGEGVGIALFSAVIKESFNEIGFRFGLQLIAASISVSFFVGLLYRPASLYHPQRRAIQHLKNQRKKMRENKLLSGSAEQKSRNYFYLDMSPLKSYTVRILILTSGVAAIGIYAPMFSISLNAAKEGSDTQDLLVIQAILGACTTLGVIIAFLLVNQPYRIRNFVVTTQVISQVFLSTVAVAILFLSFVMGYTGLCILSCIYGIGFGGFRFSLKMLALERVKLKQFSKAWGLIRGVEALPVVICVPLTSFLNDYSLKYGRAGYYICSAATAIAGIIIFFISYSNVEQNSSSTGTHRKHVNGAIPTLRTQCKSSYNPHDAELEFDYMECAHPAPPDLLNRSCISLNQVESDHGYRNASYCERLRMPCFHNRMPYNALEQQQQQQQQQLRGLRARRTTEADIMLHRGGAQHQQQQRYDFGQRSVGARMGKRLQKSLSFIQNPYCYDGQWSCNYHSNSYPWCGGAAANKEQHAAELRQPLLCTCSDSMYLPNSRSRSVPEGLSTIAQYCRCRTSQLAQSREIIYVPRNAAVTPQSRGGGTADFTCAHHNALQYINAQPLSTPPRTRRQRSQSLSKPIHFVEQITTSV